MNPITSIPISCYQRLRRSGSKGMDFILSGLARGGGAPFALAANIIVARLLGPEKFGVYMTLLSAALVAGVIATYGVGPVLVREIAARPVEQRRTIIVTIGLWALRFAGTFTVCVMALLLVWLSFGPGSPPSVWVERFAALSIIPMYVAVILVSSVLSGMHRVAKGQVLGNVGKNGFLLVGAGIFLVMGLHRIADVLWLQVLAFALAVLMGIFWISRAMPSGGAHSVAATMSEAGERTSKSVYREWRKSAKHFFSMSVAVVLLARLDVVIVNAIAGSAQAGLFGAAARLGQAATVAGLVWIAWLQPRMARQSRQGQAMALKRSLRLGIAGSTGMTSILVGLCWLFAPQLTGLLGGGFAGAIWPFRWLLLGILVWGLSVPFYVFLTMSGREKLVSRIIWLQVLLTLAASVPLVTSFGALGGAWAWAGGTLFASTLIFIVGVTNAYRPRISPESNTFRP